MAALNFRRTRLKSERGAELIEFALVLPLLLLVVLGIVDFGFLFQRMEVVTNAAREGARLGVLPGYSATDVCARVVNYVQNGGLPVTGSCPTTFTGTCCSSPTNPVITVDTAATISLPSGGTPLQGIRVDVAYTHQYVFIGPMMQLFGGNLASVPIRGVAIMRDEMASSGS
jgi:Flp pilus assembly protein TadG